MIENVYELTKLYTDLQSVEASEREKSETILMNLYLEEPLSILKFTSEILLHQQYSDYLKLQSLISLKYLITPKYQYTPEIIRKNWFSMSAELHNKVIKSIFNSVLSNHQPICSYAGLILGMIFNLEKQLFHYVFDFLIGILKSEKASVFNKISSISSLYEIFRLNNIGKAPENIWQTMLCPHIKELYCILISFLTTKSDNIDFITSIFNLLTLFSPILKRDNIIKESKVERYTLYDVVKMYLASDLYSKNLNCMDSVYSFLLVLYDLFDQSIMLEFLLSAYDISTYNSMHLISSVLIVLIDEEIKKENNNSKYNEFEIVKRNLESEFRLSITLINIYKVVNNEYSLSVLKKYLPSIFTICEKILLKPNDIDLNTYEEDSKSLVFNFVIILKNIYYFCSDNIKLFIDKYISEATTDEAKFVSLLLIRVLLSASENLSNVDIKKYKEFTLAMLKEPFLLIKDSSLKTLYKLMSKSTILHDNLFISDLIKLVDSDKIIIYRIVECVSCFLVNANPNFFSNELILTLFQLFTHIIDVSDKIDSDLITPAYQLIIDLVNNYRSEDITIIKTVACNMFEDLARITESLNSGTQETRALILVDNIIYSLQVIYAKYPHILELHFEQLLQYLILLSSNNLLITQFLNLLTTVLMITLDKSESLLKIALSTLYTCFNSQNTELITTSLVCLSNISQKDWFSYFSQTLSNVVILLKDFDCDIIQYNSPTCLKAITTIILYFKDDINIEIVETLFSKIMMMINHENVSKDRDYAVQAYDGYFISINTFLNVLSDNKDYLQSKKNVIFRPISKLINLQEYSSDLLNSLCQFLEISINIFGKNSANLFSNKNIYALLTYAISTNDIYIKERAMKLFKKITCL